MAKTLLDIIDEYFAQRSDEEVRDMVEQARADSPVDDISVDEYMRLIDPAGLNEYRESGPGRRESWLFNFYEKPGSPEVLMNRKDKGYLTAYVDY
jgi:hypothetical protein